MRFIGVINCFSKLLTLHSVCFPYFYTIVIGSLLAIIILILTNICTGKKAPLLTKAIRNYGDELESLFLKSIEEGRAIIITLKNEKVYVGFIESLFEPQKTDNTVITPLLSGYRDKEKKVLSFTTDYLKVVEAFYEKIGEDTGEALESKTLSLDT